MTNELRLSLEWNMPFQSTVTSSPQEQQLNKIVQIVREKIKPPSPQRRRTRSQSGAKEPLTNIEQKNNTGEIQVNKGKTNQNTNKGEKTNETNNQQKQINKENTRTARNNRSQHKEKTPKQNPEAKTKANNKENTNIEAQENAQNIITSTPTER